MVGMSNQQEEKISCCGARALARNEDTTKGVAFYELHHAFYLDQMGEK